MTYNEVYEAFERIADRLIADGVDPWLVVNVLQDLLDNTECEIEEEGKSADEA